MTATVEEQATEDIPEVNLKAFSDRLLAEVSTEGFPRMYEFHQLTRRRRAELTRKIGDLMPKLQMVQQAAVTVSGPQSGFVELGDVMEFLADVEDLLETIAVDAQEFRTWAGADADDKQLLALFAQFVGSFSSGEASSSSS